MRAWCWPISSLSRPQDTIRRGWTRISGSGSEDEGRLAEPWTVETATDMLYALISTVMIERLVTDCEWHQDRLAEHLAHLFQRTFAD